MKKRLLALIMAGLLTASLASCVAVGNQESTGGTESTPTVNNGGDNNDPVQDPNAWKDVDKLLYTYSNETALRAEAKAGATLLERLPAETELHCVRQNKTWSEVEYNGKTGYVQTATVTAIDILAKKFTPVEGGKKTMYAITDDVNIRLYPATPTELSVSKAVGSLDTNEAVTVVSENGKWSRIEVKDGDNTNYYFVSSNYLSARKQIDYNDTSLWASYFTECDPQLTLYTTGAVNLRKAPYAPEVGKPNTGAPSIGVLNAGVEVTVVATGTMPDGGGSWSRVIVRIKGASGDPDKVSEGYVNSKYLSERPIDAPQTLDDLLDLYTGFDAFSKAQTMYVLKDTTLNVRSSPIIPGKDEESNLVGGLEEKEAVTVVAYGMHEGISFYVIKHTFNKTEGYYFVSASYLTIDKDGRKMLTEDSLKLYPKFEILETERETTVGWEFANCYYTYTHGTDETPAKVLTTGDAVTVIAEGTGIGAESVWAVIKTADGTLYFVAKDALV